MVTALITLGSLSSTICCLVLVLCICDAETPHSQLKLNNLRQWLLEGPVTQTPKASLKFKIIKIREHIYKCNQRAHTQICNVFQEVHLLVGTIFSPKEFMKFLTVGCHTPCLLSEAPVLWPICYRPLASAGKYLENYLLNRLVLIAHKSVRQFRFLSGKHFSLLMPGI